MTRKLSILGSTGSIGRNTLDVVRRFAADFEVVALAAGNNDELMAAQVAEFRPKFVSMKDAEALARLKSRLGDATGCEFSCGREGAVAVATHPEADMVVSAMVGAAGLVPTHAALLAKKPVALANKESLVVAGRIMTAAARKNNVPLLPVDSEHSAIFQCLQGHNTSEVDRIYLTASGGPFLDWPVHKQSEITVEQALNHPTWSMGPKITVDSSTLMNKGLEAIEARWLFDLPPERIVPLIHPKSYVHSMVAYVDGSIIAQIGCHDMRGPIAYALSYPKRLELPFNRFDPAADGQWEFRRPNPDQFPCLGLAFDAMQAGDGYPAVLNAANEVAVAEFLGRRLPYTGIARLNRATLDHARKIKLGDGVACLEDVLEIDKESRRIARAEMAALHGAAR